MKSVSQRVSKLLAVKIGGLKKKSATWPWPHSNQSARIQVCLGSNHFQNLMASNFAALWSRDPKFSVLKDLSCLKSLSSSPSPTNANRPRFEIARGQIIVKVWWPVTLQPFNLQSPNFHHLIFLKTVSKFQEDSSILKVEFSLSKWHYFIS